MHVWTSVGLVRGSQPIVRFNSKPLRKTKIRGRKKQNNRKPTHKKRRSFLKKLQRHKKISKKERPHWNYTLPGVAGAT
jgi:hypothetical protein